MVSIILDLSSRVLRAVLVRLTTLLLAVRGIVGGCVREKGEWRRDRYTELWLLFSYSYSSSAALHFLPAFLQIFGLAETRRAERLARHTRSRERPRLTRGRAGPRHGILDRQRKFPTR